MRSAKEEFVQIIRETQAIRSTRFLRLERSIPASNHLPQSLRPEARIPASST